ncbi:MAG: hypothetical protein A3D41_02595 [Candidatus Sungbacteria bacterium RIFCSPHIGHO2_02_FULL_41_12b]|nr:MAG: hypothetical protein A3D41_02595 [Candidatus Sungbacteria bacterium RIFCSPHIGHO2_02_FULL_41_12b]
MLFRGLNSFWTAWNFMEGVHFNKIKTEAKKEPEYGWENRVWKTRNFEEGQFKYEVFKREGFSVEDILKKKGVSVEIAGPTNNGFWFHGFSDKSTEITSFNLAEVKKILTSNLYPGAPLFSDEGLVGYSGKADFIADARKMPIKKEGADLVYCSCLGSIAENGLKKIIQAKPKDMPAVEKERLVSESLSGEIGDNYKLREQAIDESWNILKPGGILVWQGGVFHDVDFAIKRGFVLLQREQKYIKTPDGSNDEEPT